MFQDIPDYDDQRPNQRALLEQLRGPGLQAAEPATPVPALGAPARSIHGAWSTIAREGIPALFNKPKAESSSGASGVGGAMRNAASALAGLGQPTAPALPEAAPMAAPPQPKYGKDIGKREYMDWAGINAEKFDSDHDSPKYQVLRTLSHFDPSQGITPDVLAALNQLGLGTFSGQKDKLRVSGQVDPRFEGFTEMDLIRGFNDPNNKQKAWGYGAINPNAPQQGAGLPAMQSASGSLNGLLAGGDPLAAIQAAIAQYQKPQSNIQALLAQLGR